MSASDVIISCRKKGCQAMPTRPSKRSMIPQIITILKEEGPLSYQEVTKKLENKGWKPTGKTKPESLVYMQLRNCCLQQDSQIVKAGRGVFECRTEKSNIIFTVDQSKPKNVKRAVGKVCGSCSYMQFSGIGEATREWGSCENDKSGRLCVHPSDDCCPYWKQKSKSVEQRERNEQIKWLELIKGVNLSVQRRRG